MATVGKFDINEDANGLAIVAKTDRMSSSCMNATEIDWAVQALKADLDAVARLMKRRLEQRKNEDIV